MKMPSIRSDDWLRLMPEAHLEGRLPRVQGYIQGAVTPNKNWNVYGAIVALDCKINFPGDIAAAGIVKLILVNNNNNILNKAH